MEWFIFIKKKLNHALLLPRTTGCCCMPVGTVTIASSQTPAVSTSTRSCTRSSLFQIYMKTLSDDYFANSPFKVDEITNIVTDVTGDPTLPRSNERPCPECRHREAVFFQVTSLSSEMPKVFLSCV